MQLTRFKRRVIKMSKEQKKFANTPIPIEPWEKEKLRRFATRRASVAFALRTLTESLDEVTFDSWAFWDEIIKKYNLDPSKDHYEFNGEIHERAYPWSKPK